MPENRFRHLFYPIGMVSPYFRYELWVTIFSVIIRRIIFVIEIQKANRLALVHRNIVLQEIPDGNYRKMPENVEGLQIAGKKFYKAAEGAALYSMGIHTFERIAKDAKAKYKIGKSALYNVEKIDEYLEHFLEED